MFYIYEILFFFVLSELVRYINEKGMTDRGNGILGSRVRLVFIFVWFIFVKYICNTFWFHSDGIIKIFLVKGLLRKMVIKEFVFKYFRGFRVFDGYDPVNTQGFIKL